MSLVIRIIETLIVRPTSTHRDCILFLSLLSLFSSFFFKRGSAKQSVTCINSDCAKVQLKTSSVEAEKDKNDNKNAV